jgi:hypothetical protein
MDLKRLAGAAAIAATVGLLLLGTAPANAAPLDTPTTTDTAAPKPPVPTTGAVPHSGGGGPHSGGGSMTNTKSP